MVFESEQEVIKLIKANLATPAWVGGVRKQSKVLRALVLGEDYSELLINEIEKIESKERAKARKKYSKDIRDMFHRVHEARDNVFSASGGGLDIEISSEAFKEKFIDHLTEFKGNKSLFQYLSEYYFSLLDVDPNGLIMLEYVKDEKIYPAYKSTGDIRNYVSDGQKLEWVMFEPKKEVLNDKRTMHVWRVVDDVKDWFIIQINSDFILDPERTFEHPFGEVPAVVLSGLNKLGTEIRFSPLFPIEELSKDYARDKSVITIYKFIHGFTKEWRHRQMCQSCRGTGKTGESKCEPCSGQGWMGKNDVTDVINVEPPRETDSPLITEPAGFIQPDIKTWDKYNEELLTMEEKIHRTVWGTDKVSKQGDKTATEVVFVNVQPVTNRLNKLSNNIQWIDNTIANWVLRWVENNAKTKDSYHRSYGRGFIIESPDALLVRYEKARTDESSFTVLNRLLGEYLLSKYHNNPLVLEEMRKEAMVEPYVHMKTLDVSEVFGREEALRKQLFGDFWEQTDRTQDVEILKDEFETHFQANKEKFKAPELPEPVIPPTE